MVKVLIDIRLGLLICLTPLQVNWVMEINSGVDDLFDTFTGKLGHGD